MSKTGASTRSFQNSLGGGRSVGRSRPPLRNPTVTDDRVSRDKREMLPPILHQPLFVSDHDDVNSNPEATTEQHPILQPFQSSVINQESDEGSSNEPPRHLSQNRNQQAAPRHGNNIHPLQLVFHETVAGRPDAAVNYNPNNEPVWVRHGPQHSARFDTVSNRNDIVGLGQHRDQGANEIRMQDSEQMALLADFKYDNSARRDDDGQRPRFSRDNSLILNDDIQRIFGSGQVTGQNRSILTMKEVNDFMAVGQQQQQQHAIYEEQKQSEPRRSRNMNSTVFQQDQHQLDDSVAGENEILFVQDDQINDSFSNQEFFAAQQQHQRSGNLESSIDGDDEYDKGEDDELHSYSADQMQHGIHQIDVNYATGTINDQSSHRVPMQGHAINLQLMNTPTSTMDNDNITAHNTAFRQDENRDSSEFTSKQSPQSVKVQHIDSWHLHKTLRQAIQACRKQHKAAGYSLSSQESVRVPDTISIEMILQKQFSLKQPKSSEIVSLMSFSEDDGRLHLQKLDKSAISQVLQHWAARMHHLQQQNAHKSILPLCLSKWRLSSLQHQQGEVILAEQPDWRCDLFTASCIENVNQLVHFWRQVVDSEQLKSLRDSSNVVLKIMLQQYLPPVDHGSATGVPRSADRQTIYRVTQDSGNGFDVHRLTNFALLNSFSSLNYVLLSEIYEAKLQSLTHEQVDRLMHRMRKRTLERLVRDHAHLGSKVTGPGVMDGNSSAASSSQLALELSLCPSIKPLDGTINGSDLFLQEFAPIANGAQEADLAKPQIIMQHLLDSQRLTSERKGDYAQQELFQQYFVKSHDSSSYCVDQIKFLTGNRQQKRVIEHAFHYTSSLAQLLQRDEPRRALDTISCDFVDSGKGLTLLAVNSYSWREQPEQILQQHPSIHQSMPFQQQIVNDNFSQVPKGTFPEQANNFQDKVSVLFEDFRQSLLQLSGTNNVQLGMSPPSHFDHTVNHNQMLFMDNHHMATMSPQQLNLNQQYEPLNQQDNVQVVLSKIHSIADEQQQQSANFNGIMIDYNQEADVPVEQLESLNGFSMVQGHADTSAIIIPTVEHSSAGTAIFDVKPDRQTVHQKHKRRSTLPAKPSNDEDFWQPGQIEQLDQVAKHKLTQPDKVPSLIEQPDEFQQQQDKQPVQQIEKSKLDVSTFELVNISPAVKPPDMDQEQTAEQVKDEVKVETQLDRREDCEKEDDGQIKEKQTEMTAEVSVEPVRDQHVTPTSTTLAKSQIMNQSKDDEISLNVRLEQRLSELQSQFLSAIARLDDQIKENKELKELMISIQQEKKRSEEQSEAVKAANDEVVTEKVPNPPRLPVNNLQKRRQSVQHISKFGGEKVLADTKAKPAIRRKLTMPENEGFALNASSLQRQRTLQVPKGISYNSPYSQNELDQQSQSVNSSVAISVPSKGKGGIPRVPSPTRQGDTISESPEAIKDRVKQRQEQRLEKLHEQNEKAKVDTSSASSSELSSVQPKRFLRRIMTGSLDDVETRNKIRRKTTGDSMELKIEPIQPSSPAKIDLEAIKEPEKAESSSTKDKQKSGEDVAAGPAQGKFLTVVPLPNLRNLEVRSSRGNVESNSPNMSCKSQQRSQNKERARSLSDRNDQSPKSESSSISHKTREIKKQIKRLSGAKIEISHNKMSEDQSSTKRADDLLKVRQMQGSESIFREKLNELKVKNVDCVIEISSSESRGSNYMSSQSQRRFDAEETQRHLMNQIESLANFIKRQKYNATMKSVSSLSAHKTQDKRSDKNDDEHESVDMKSRKQTSTRSVLVKIDKYGGLRCNFNGMKQPNNEWQTTSNSNTEISAKSRVTPTLSGQGVELLQSFLTSITTSYQATSGHSQRKQLASQRTKTKLELPELPTRQFLTEVVKNSSSTVPGLKVEEVKQGKDEITFTLSADSGTCRNRDRASAVKDIVPKQPTQSVCKKRSQKQLKGPLSFSDSIEQMSGEMQKAKNRRRNTICASHQKINLPPITQTGRKHEADEKTSATKSKNKSMKNLFGTTQSRHIKDSTRKIPRSLSDEWGKELRSSSSDSSRRVRADPFSEDGDARNDEGSLRLQSRPSDSFEKAIAMLPTYQSVVAPLVSVCLPGAFVNDMIQANQEQSFEFTDDEGRGAVHRSEKKKAERNVTFGGDKQEIEANIAQGTEALGEPSRPYHHPDVNQIDFEA